MQVNGTVAMIGIASVRHPIAFRIVDHREGLSVCLLLAQERSHHLGQFSAARQRPKPPWKQLRPCAPSQLAPPAKFLLHSRTLARSSEPQRR